MATITKRSKGVLKKMTEDKEKIREYLKSGDESKKPAGIKFFTPDFILPDKG